MKLCRLFRARTEEREDFVQSVIKLQDHTDYCITTDSRFCNFVVGLLVGLFGLARGSAASTPRQEIELARAKRMLRSSGRSTCESFLFPLRLGVMV